ncbi:MAG TPA: hydantoinase B/oxoprolinase family protein [Chloroflexota bacterium]|nr:hydantoinase B/oxoprolinase family protein [Chloroflexota bacterium]
MTISQTVTATTIDPITLEVLWNRLLSVCSEQQAALMRTAFSTIVRESQDLACGVFDVRGNMVAQSETGTPGHINAMATGVRHFLKVYPPESLSPGDVLLTNDPWMTAGQINDITILTPVFRNGTCVALFANTCHVADIGGRILSAEAREVYEEGLYLPIMKLFDKGERNEILFQIIRGNVRLPDEVEGDLYAMTTCNDVGGARLLELMDEFDLDTIEPLSDAIIERSEQALRAAIRELPDGVYENELWSDGFEAPIVLKAKVIVEGDSMTVDHTGSSPQSRFGINSVLNYTHAYTSFAVKAAICPDVPHNEGSFRPVHVMAPEGTILNPKYPAPVAARHIIGHFLPNLIFGALVDVIPDRLMAEGAAPLWATVFRGEEKTGRTFNLTIFQCGGTGARPTKDGLNNIGFPSGVAGVPAEVIENLTAMMLERREIKPDSGGPGRFRGGCGQYTTFRTTSGLPWSMAGMRDRTQFRAKGYLGGKDGAIGEFFLSTGERPNPKAYLTLEPDVSATLEPPGGGGFFDPFTRDPEAVLQDVIYGYVTVAGAERDYGVKITCSKRPEERISLPEHYAIDREATRTLRERSGGGGRRCRS